MVNGVRYTGSQANNGGVAVGPLTYTQNFTLTANDVTGVQVQRTVTANVGNISTVCKIYSFMANGSTTATVAYNASATLSWVTTGCSSATVNGVTYTGPNALSDSITTLPLTSPVNTFTLTATDSSGNTDNSTVTVNVGNKQSACSIVSFTANGLTGSVTVSPNSSATLAWTTTNCTSVAVNGFTYTDTASVNAGTVTVNVTNGTYNYTLSAIDATGTNISKTVTLLTNQNDQGSSCQIVSFQPSQTSVTPGTSVTLNWVLTNCNGYATVSGGNLGNTQVYNSFITTGAIYSNTTFTLVAYGSNGYASTANTYVNINNNNTSTGCYISTFAANGSNFTTINPGTTANITWGVSGCSSVTVAGPGIYSQNTTGSMQTPALYASTQYTITAYDLFYNNPQTKTIYVYTSGSGGNTNQTMYAPITTIATRVATTSARLNGLVPANGSVGSVSAYFEYGTSSALGSTTNPQIVSTNTLVNYFDSIPTSPSTTYYFRAVTQNGNTFLRGDIISFVTPATQTTPIVIQNVTYGTGTGSALASVTIADQSQSVKAGDYVSYTVDYKNVSNQTLSNVTLNVILPNGVTFRGSTQGMPTTNNTVVIGLNTLDKGAEGSVNIQASVDQSVVPGTNLVATATLTFTNTAGAQDSAIGYVLNNVAGSSISATTTDQNNIGAFALGAGFFPTTFLGWVILLGIIIIIILLIRHFVLVGGANQNKGHYADPHGDVHH